LKSRRFPDGDGIGEKEDVGMEKKTDGEEVETPFEILLVVGLECCGPSLEFSFEGHVGQVETEGTDGKGWGR
jgi:hypothetical protein